MNIEIDFVEFVTTVQHGSFSKAASILGVSKSHISKQVSRLEQRLGVQLLVRSTRKISLTEIGRAYFERCERILDEVREAESVVSEIKGEPQGVLNISLPNTVGERYIVPLIAGFMSRHPGIRVNASISTRNVDLLEENFDLAIRIGKLAESRLVARKLTDIRWIVCASPDYCKNYGVPATPDELVQHNCLVFDLFGAHSESYWSLSNAGQITRFPVKGIYFSNNADSLINCALEDIGLVYLPDLFLRDYINKAALQQVLTDWGSETALSLVYPYSRHLSIKVRRFVDYLIENLDFEKTRPVVMS
ncbi:MAG: LysR family transcriptional regulator [Gammaproteobacteria bacterium]|nr:LysR family transcriptional regulator [Gammaproteobacteria bacterium]